MNKKVALVTGSAKRIGKEIVLHLANNNYQPLIHYNQSGKSMFSYKKYKDLYLLCNDNLGKYGKVCSPVRVVAKYFKEIYTQRFSGFSGKEEASKQ